MRDIILAILAVIAVIVRLAIHVEAQSDDEWILNTRITCTDQECDEGYFKLDDHVMIVVEPKSGFYKYMKSIVGRKVQLTWRMGE
jgi:hypothetical protein